ncbi:MAG: class I SAM-dependent methyltransferase [Actinomycetota bacterium]|nr:class I SAM-dependent methyltransferase [Actinomycetota bacterium]
MSTHLNDTDHERGGFFDFLEDNPRYAGKRLSINRLNRRHEFLVRQHLADIEGARVLDLASHDGRWSYALSAAGAASVVGIEARADQIEQFASYPAGRVKDRVRLVHGDVYDELPKLVDRREMFDVVAVYGLYYHLMDHYGLLKLIKKLCPRVVIIDSEFHLSSAPTVRLAVEPTDSHLNSVPHEARQEVAPVGIPSRAAMELMAHSLGYDVAWADWEALPRSRRGGLKAYYRTSPAWKRRGTCTLRPGR